jgi:dTDP-glucose 4,6-dehydratase
MKILVTGAGGFIGSHVVENLLTHGHNVRALVHYNGKGSYGHLTNMPPDVGNRREIVLGDVTDGYQMRKIVEGCDAVCHLAALIGIPYSYDAPNSYVNTNVIGTLNILEACKHWKVNRLVVTSTSEVYGTALYAPIDENHPLQGQSPYSATKIGADKLAESYYRSFSLPVVILRPFNTYGPRQSARAIIPTILTQALSGVKKIHLGSLSPKRDLTFVEDTAEAFRLAVEKPGIEGETIHFGSGKAISIGELAQLCLQTVNSQAEIITSEERIRPAKSEVELLLCNPQKAKEKLMWEPRISLSEGIKRTAHYLEKRLSEYDISRYVV